MSARRLMIGFMILAAALTAGCLGSTQPRPAGPASAAAGVGAGAMLDPGSRWQGGVIGAEQKEAATGSMTEVGDRAARRAAREGRPIAYVNQAGDRRVEAYPIARRGDCHWVSVRCHENGLLVKQMERRICLP